MVTTSGKKEGTVIVSPSEITLEVRTSDPSPLELGMVWFRDDFNELRVAEHDGFATPATSPQGIGFDSADCIWHADRKPAEIYELDQGGSVISSFAAPSDNPIGLGVDSADCIWNVDTSPDKFFQLDRTGSIVSSFASPSTAPRGVGLDSADCIWHADSDLVEILELDQTGTIISSFASPSSGPNGVGLDSGDCIWHGDGAGNKMYKLNRDPGRVIGPCVVSTAIQTA